VTIYSQAKGYTDRPIFLAWLTETFIPEVLRRREAFGYAGPAVLIIDNCTAHTGAEVDEWCEGHGIRVCPLPPHSSNQVQPLDLSTFGVTKRLIARVNRMENVNVQSAHIAQVVSAFMSASSPLNVVGTFLSAGIALSLGAGGRFFCRVARERARCLLAPFDPVSEPRPTEAETGGHEAELYVEHCIDLASDEMPCPAE
jgi:hypothetical protein